MTVRALDTQGDWTRGRGRGNYLDGNNMLAQQLSCDLKEFLGDCFWALANGIDWFNLIQTKNMAGLDVAIRTRILNRAGVTGLQEFEFTIDPDTRDIAISYGVTTVYSDQILRDSVNILATQSFMGLITQSGEPIHA